MPSHKKTHNIFLIDSAKMNARSSPQIPLTAEQMIDLIMTPYKDYIRQSLLGGTPVNEKTIGPNNTTFHFSLYFRSEPHTSKFSDFCRDFVEDGQPAVTHQSVSASSVLFIWTDQYLFAVTTGQGFRVAERFAVPRFGLMVASVFNDNLRVSSLDSNVVSGLVHSTRTIYARDVDFISVSELDHIAKEIVGKINGQDKIDLLLDNNTRTSLTVTAKRSIQFSSSLDLDGLLKLLCNMIEHCDLGHLQDRFNMLTLVTDPDECNAITDTIIGQMYKAYTDDEKCPFLLFSRDTNLFLSRSLYQIYDPSDEDRILSESNEFDTTQLLHQAYTNYHTGKQIAESKDNFREFMETCMLRTPHEGQDIKENPATNDILLDHIVGEVEHGGVNHYAFYGEYHCQSANFVQRVNDSLKRKLDAGNYKFRIGTQLWPNNQNEHWFNENASAVDDYVHLHKIKPDYIEFCDLLKYEPAANGNPAVVTIVHVKDGFDGDMRVLEHQVEMSIAKIRELKDSNSSAYLEHVYNLSVTTPQNGQRWKRITSQFADYQSFARALKNSQIRYVIVIRPKQYEDLLRNNSNIAKHCLNAMLLRCFNQGIDLKIDVRFRE